jgi:hypothetical protein
MIFSRHCIERFEAVTDPVVSNCVAAWQGNAVLAIGQHCRVRGVRVDDDE